MLKTLLKKQLLEINRSFFLNPKTGKSRGRAGSIVWIALYAVLVVGVLGGLFVWVSSQLCTAMTGLGLDWLYFTVLGLMAVALGVFGSVFNTYAGLYLAKDNDLLLSMPIPVRDILMSRLLGVYLMGLMFSGVVMIPAAAVYAVQGTCTAATLLGAVLSVLVVSLIVLILSCLLGWVVAQISRRLKNKSFITVLASLAFLAVYYLFYFRATELLGALVENALSVGGAIRRAAYPLYAFGQMGAGNLWAALAVTAAVLLLTVLTCYVLSRGFLKLATASVGTGRAVYRERAAKVRSVDGALLQKELRRFTASPTYMLNCGLATLLLPAAAIALLLKGGWLAEILNPLFEPDTGAVTVMAITAVEWLATTNIISTPSVSLEGKSLWLVQSLPVTPWQVLRAKLSLHLLLTEIPTFVCALCAVLVLAPSVPTALLGVLMPCLCVLLSAELGLALDLRKPNLTWSNEVTPIKQSMNVMLTLFGGWMYTALFAVGYFTVGAVLGAAGYMAVFGVLSAVLSLLLYRWLKHTGAAKLAAL